MVALKRHWRCEWDTPRPMKQERRGGIETQIEALTGQPVEQGSRNAVVALKRETRGGSGGAYPREAGTPWWH